MALVELYIAATSALALVLVLAGLVSPVVSGRFEAKASRGLRLVHSKGRVDAPRRPLHA